MKYLIVLDKNSIVGSIYATGHNDGLVEGDHPVLVCSKIETDNPYYIYAIRSGKKGGSSHQSLYLPHGSVALILEYDKSDPHPLGFSG